MSWRRSHLIVSAVLIFIADIGMVYMEEDACKDLCFHGGTCAKVTEGYKCTCTENYVGTRCEGIKRFCVSDSPCHNEALCEDIHNGGYRCFCQPGYYGNNCETEIDECESMPCRGNSTCIDLLNGFSCICQQGSTGTRCDLAFNGTGCSLAPCRNGGTCLDTEANGQYVCLCPHGFTGINCEVNVDECKSSPCELFQVCIDLVGGYRCDCPAGRVGSGCNEIVDPCISNPCHNNGTCLNEKDRYTCRCKQEFAGINCEIKKDACQPNPCLHNGSCVSNYTLVSGYVCNCSQGFVGDRCEGKVPLCDSQPCLHGGTCLDNLYTPGYTCQCMSEYSGNNCEKKLEGCQLIPCENQGTCVDNNTVPVCHCAVGWSGSTCATDVNECDHVPCYNGGQCINLSGSYICLCAPPWTGNQCESDFLECEMSPCRNNATCTEVVGGPAVCHCRANTTGKFCELTLGEETGCQSEPCQNGAKCISNFDNYTCVCLPGFEGKQCERNVDDCLHSPCKNDAMCIDLVNGYKCNCTAGFTGVNCTTAVSQNHCMQDPCQHNGTCVDGNNSYICVCESGYTGQNCSQRVTPCSKTPCMFGGTCSELPGNNDSRCDCVPGTKGNQCELVTMAMFSGSSGVTLPSIDWSIEDVLMANVTNSSNTNISSKAERNVKVWFSTTILEGTLLTITGESESEDGRPGHLLMQLVAGSLFVSVNLYGPTVTGMLALPATQKMISQNVVISHTVSVSITHSELTLILLDNCSTNETCSLTLMFDPGDEMVDLTGSVVIGGLGQIGQYLRSKLKTDKNFVGCLGNFTVNNAVVNLMPDPLLNLTHLVTPGCRGSDLCTNATCRNGGQCQDMWFSSHCTCPSGFTGPRCEIKNMIQFAGGSFLHLGGYTNIKSLSFWVSSNVMDGMILYTLSNDKISIYMKDGILLLHVLINSTDNVKVIGNISSGDWFLISTKFDQLKYRASIMDTQHEVLASMSGDVGKVLDVQTPLYMGQLHQHPATNIWRNKTQHKQHSSFAGCVQNLTINNLTVDFQAASQSIFGNDPGLPVPGCTREGTCSLLPCQHGGTCQTGWGTFTCQCPVTFQGDNCESAQPVMLSDGAYMELLVNTSLFPFGDSGSFQFRTRDETVSLMFVQFSNRGAPNTSLEVSLFQTRLHVTVDDGNTSLKRFNESVSDGAWHTVTWQWNYTSITVHLDSGLMMIMTELLDPVMYDPVVSVFFGGKPYQPGNTAYMIGSMKGCIRNITLDGYSIPYLDDTVSRGLVLHRKDVQTGCHGDDVCRTSPCPGYSKCEDVWNARNCTCLEGWEGNNCNVSIDDCLNNSCVHSACKDGHQNYTCICETGYTGQSCDIVIDACDTRPCHDNGTVNCTLVFPAQFRCLCKSGWTGLDCFQEINECKSSPCLNDGLCRDMVDGFSCECRRDYFGERCEEKEICSSVPCFNGGTCTAEKNNTDFSCKCLQRYSGKQCQTYDFCYENFCRNNATCISNSQGYICECPPVNYGVYCQYVDYCSSLPCLNNGTCYSDRDKFRCSCNELYSGVQCEIPVDRCEQKLCKNGATCVFKPTNQTSDYVCYCVEGFTGLNCETDINECQSNPCQNGALCKESSQQPWNFFPGFHCVCKDGFYGAVCEHERNECESSPCANNGTCSDLINKYECVCAEGFSGTHCQHDTRGCTSAPCENGARCVENIDSTYNCVCDKGYYGDLCQYNIENCLNNMCENNSTCISNVDNYTCVCLPGFGGQFCEQTVDACFSQPCLNHGRCIYQGHCDCEEVVEICGSYNDTCQVELCSQWENCTHLPVPYMCNCSNTGYEESNCGIDVDECKTFSNNTCENGGICVNTVGSYRCNCRLTGYTGNRCEVDIDECSTYSPCFNGGVCENLPGSFKCACLAGWTGVTCGELVNHCVGQPCQYGGRCVNTVSDFMCDCSNTGYQGKTCTDQVNDCAGNPCLNGGICIDDTNAFTCKCSGTGYYGSLCQLKVNNCAGTPCKNNGSCNDVGVTFRCECMTGYTGTLCSEDLDECLTMMHRCAEGSTCLNSPGTYSCVCSEDFTGQFCGIILERSEEQLGSSNTGVIAGSVSVIVIITIAIIVSVCWYTRKSRRMKGKYKPSQVERISGISTRIPLHKIIDQSGKERLV